MSTSQRAVTPCGWGVKAGMVRVWVAGKAVWSHCYTRAISERFREKRLIIKHHINSSVYLLYTDRQTQTQIQSQTQTHKQTDRQTQTDRRLCVDLFEYLSVQTDSTDRSSSRVLSTSSLSGSSCLLDNVNEISVLASWLRSTLSSSATFSPDIIIIIIDIIIIIISTASVTVSRQIDRYRQSKV